jgi:hypothetical protein
LDVTQFSEQILSILHWQVGHLQALKSQFGVEKTRASLTAASDEDEDGLMLCECSLTRL